MRTENSDQYSRFVEVIERYMDLEKESILIGEYADARRAVHSAGIVSLNLPASVRLAHSLDTRMSKLERRT